MFRMRVKHYIAAFQPGKDLIHDHLSDPVSAVLIPHGYVIHGRLTNAVRNGSSDTDQFSFVLDKDSSSHSISEVHLLHQNQYLHKYR